MSQVITVAQQKGGAGKTTLLVQLATAFTEAGHEVAMVDIDPQASLTGWMRVREHQVAEAAGPAALHLSMIGGWRLGVELDRLRRQHTIILVDTPPHAESDAKTAIRAADLVLIPCQPSPADLWATRATFTLATKDGRNVSLVLNRVPPRSRSVEETQAAIARDGWPCLESRLGNRQSFVSSFGRGLGVIESEPKSAAAAEVKALLTEVTALLA